MPLMFSVSGLRGIVAKDITPEIVLCYARAFGRFLGPGKIVIGRDARESGPMFRRAVIRGLRSARCSIIDLGVVPTPTVLFMVRKLRAKGGIAITASHNPIQWNALKFITEKGQFLDQKRFIRFARYIDQKHKPAEVSKKKKGVRVDSKGVDIHTDKIIAMLRGDLRRFRVGVDAVNGAGSIALPMLLEKMGCEVHRLHCEFSPKFPRRPEPTSGNISALCQLVKKNKLDIGFAVDPDCDRLSIVDENAKAIGEEKTLVLATDFCLCRTRGNVVTNLSTTALMDYIVQKYDSILYRTKIGEANVVSKMHVVNAVVGGEGNGGVIYPRINFTRDALVGAAIILKLMSVRDTTISEICASYPHYYMIKKKIRMPNEQFIKKQSKIIHTFRGKINTLDGLRITTGNYWLHIRPSQTEPFIRIIGEAKERKVIEKYIRKIEATLRNT